MENFKPGKAQTKAMAGILQKRVAYGQLTLYEGICESRPIGNTIFCIYLLDKTCSIVEQDPCAYLCWVRIGAALGNEFLTIS